MHLNILQRLSLKTRVSLFTLAIFLGGLWSLSYYAAHMLREDMEQLLGQQQFATVSLVAAAVNDELDGRIKARLSGQGGDLREPNWGPFSKALP